MKASTPQERPGAESSGKGAPAPRKHRATGNPKGGKRPGAGRPPGSKDVLPRGAVAAIKAAGLRIPPTATEAERELADRALVRIAEVMEEKVSPFGAFSVLTAARGLREEICGKVVNKLEVKAPESDEEVTDAEWAALAKLEHEVRGG